MQNNNPLEKFVTLYADEVYTPVVSLYQRDIVSASSLVCDKEEIGQLVNKLSEEEKDVLQRIIISAVGKTAHYFLFLAEQEKIKILVDDVNVALLSDGLSGELESVGLGTRK